VRLESFCERGNATRQNEKKGKGKRPKDAWCDGTNHDLSAALAGGVLAKNCPQSGAQDLEKAGMGRGGGK